ncbi:hypothetical protein MA16_Dca015345 [Dendrobium catenatum]|uniref:Uncharacterized protein n=1 Tax=Dendrobium catenatum TaxID=906689 RepID=A0A2I0W1C6_9ASPA|nr:hypothetical protein MA16_Dca015345 [Dendrobium catenatum]
MPSTLSESSQAHLSPRSAAVQTVWDYNTPHDTGYDVQKLLKAVASFRLRNGITPMMRRTIPDFLKEVKDFVPEGLSERRLFLKLRALQERFRNFPSPGPNCTDFDRSFYELGLKAWRSPLLRARKASGSVKCNEKSVGMKNKSKGAEESENEDDDDAQRETEESMELGIDEEDEPLENGNVNLPDQDEADSPYKNLKHALEDFWIAKNLDLNVLQLALQKVDSVQAKYLDEQFMEIAKDELRLKVKKNRLSNEIINFLCNAMK